MKKKIVGLFAVCLAVFAGIKIYQVNRNVYIPENVVFSKGECVEYEEDFTNDVSECIDGYSVRIVDSKLLSIEEYYKNYLHSDVTLSDDYHSKYYYVIHVEFHNEDNKQVGTMGVNLTQTPLVGINYMMVIDMSTFSALNPDFPGLGFSLLEGTSCEVLLPYAVVPEVHADYETLVKNPPMLQITAYPRRKLLKIE